MRSLLKSFFESSSSSIARRQTTRRSYGRARHLGRTPAAEILEDRALLASQMIASDAATRTVTPGQTIDVPVFYSTLDDSGQPAALGANLISFNLHFDDNVLAFLETDPQTIVQESAAVLPTTAQSETADGITGVDTDPNTQTVITSAYSDHDSLFNPGWPNTPSTSPLRLYVATFRVDSNFSGSTNINFSANATGNVTGQAEQFDFDFTPLVLSTGTSNTPPVINSAAAASVDENQTSAIDVNASDADNDTLTYSISGGADAASFSINSGTGVVTFNAAPDFEAPADNGGNNVYDLQVSVSDSTASVTQNIAITVNDVNEGGGGNNAPVINSAASNEVPENQTSAIDVDASDAENDTLTYSISGGADSSAFSIESGTGIVTFNTAPDFENPTDAGGDNRYDVQVRVDDGTGFAIQDIAIRVSDVNEDLNDAPVITSAATSSVTENQTSAIDVNATDANNDTLIYSISGGPDGGLFGIDSGTGVVTFNNAPDFENPLDAGGNNVYDLQVSVTDGSASDNQDIAITVGNDSTDDVTGEGTIRTQKWNDLNGNGIQESNEPLLSGWTIEVLSGGSVVDQGVTTDSGWLEFTVAPGTFTLREVAQDGWTQTAPVNSLAATAYSLDMQYNLQPAQNSFLNWGGLNETWMWGSGDWFYLTPNGDFYEWNGSARENLSGTLIDSFNSDYYNDPALLYNAPETATSTITVGDGQTVDVQFGNQADDVEPPPPSGGEFNGVGNVNARIAGNRHLILTGDRNGNGVMIYTNDDGHVTVAGLGDTTIQGQPQWVIEGWSEIPGDLRATMRGGNDAVVLQNIDVGEDVAVNLGGGNDYFIATNVSTAARFDVRGAAGNDSINVQHLNVGSHAKFIGGGGNDSVYSADVFVGGNSVVQGNGGNDLFVSHDSSFAGTVALNLGGGHDQAIVGMGNSFDAAVTADGASGTDALQADSSTSYSSEPVIRRFEQDSIDDVDGILDSLMQRLADAGLDGLLDPN